MFTGIVAAIGKIVTIEPCGEGYRLTLHAGDLDLRDVCIGDSIAVNGVCLTVAELGQTGFGADVSGETLRCTVGLDAPRDVNLEKALRLADRLGGHLVSGHVDGVGEVTRFEALGASFLLVVRVPHDLSKYIARKGSITVDGVSLTVNEVATSEFRINLIPHTLGATTLKRLSVGAKVNLEIDLLARYVERIINHQSE